jgi:hypothetical protein
MYTFAGLDSSESLRSTKLHPAEMGELLPVDQLWP